MRPIDRFLARLESKGLSAEEEGKGWICQCPAHNDGRPSLSVSEASDGKVLLKCFAGCRSEAIVAALQMEMKELFPDRGESSFPAPSPSRGRGEAKEPSRKQGEKKKKAKAERKLVKTYYYGDEEGRRRHATCRYEPKGFSQYWITANGDKVWSFAEGWFEPKGKNWFRCQGAGGKDDDPPSVHARWFDAHPTYLYRLKHVLEAAKEERTVWLCEGEKDADNLGRVKGPNGKHLTTTCQPMGAGKWKPEYTEWLKGARVKMVLDRDLAGYRHGMLVYDLLDEAEVPIELHLPAAGKDATDHLSEGLTWEEFKPISREVLDELISLEEEREKERREASPAAPSDSGGGEGGNVPPGEASEGGEGPGWLELTDLGNARRFIRDHGADLHYCEQFGRWLVWEGSYWKVDELAGAPLLKRWEETLAGMEEEQRELKKQGHLLPAKDLAKHLKRSHGKSAIDAALDLAKRQEGVPVHQDELNRKRDYLPVANGVMDLRSGELLTGTRGDLFTRTIKLAYHEKAPCPVWVEHLKRCTGGDMELLSWLHKVFGYTLTGRRSEQCLFFFYGEGSTGKSTTLDTMGKVLGEFSADLDKSKLMVKRFEDEVPTHFARLIGRRMVTAVEVNKEDRFDEGLIKKLTGEGVIQTRFMRQDAFDLEVMFKLYLTGNHKPTIWGQDQGIWRRFKLIPFDREIPVEQRDKDIEAKLEAEMEGILSWLVAGAVRWYREGLGPCKSVEAATDEYRSEQDVLGLFIEESCDLDPDEETKGRDLFLRYKEWAKASAFFVMNEKKFSEEMAERQKKYRIQKSRRGDGVYWLGLTLKPTEGEW